MLIGTRYRNEWDILIPDSNGPFTLCEYVHRFTYDVYGMMTKTLDHVLVKGNRNGVARKAWLLDNNELCLLNTNPCKAYKYEKGYTGVLVRDKNGPQRVKGQFPVYHDLNLTRVYLRFDRSFSKDPYDYRGAVQAEAKHRLYKRHQKRS